MAGSVQFARGAAPDPAHWTNARAALLDRLDLAVSLAGFDFSRMVPNVFQLITASATLVNVVNITGRGIARVIIASALVNTNRQARVVITRDGVLLSDFQDVSLAEGFNNGYGYAAMTFPGGLAIGPYRMLRSGGNMIDCMPIGFMTSLLVQVSTNSAADVNCVVGVLA